MGDIGGKFKCTFLKIEFNNFDKSQWIYFYMGVIQVIHPIYVFSKGMNLVILNEIAVSMLEIIQLCLLS